jgi:hypothetical protein
VQAYQDRVSDPVLQEQVRRFRVFAEECG